MKLSNNFSLIEFTHTSTNLPNNPNQDEINNIKLLIINVLQPLRDLYGDTITINSGYRSPVVNSKIKGAVNSAHMTGRAADIDTGSNVNNKKLFELIKDNFQFRQLIWEKGDSTGPGWVHVEYNIKDNKKQILIFDGNKYVDYK